MSSEKTALKNIIYLNSLENEDYTKNAFLKKEMQEFIDNNTELSSDLFNYLLYKQFQIKTNSDTNINNSICIISENYLNTSNIPKFSLKKLTLIPYRTNSKWSLSIFFNLSKGLKHKNKIMTKLLTPFNTNDSEKLKEFLTIISKNLSLENNDYNLDIEKFKLDNKKLSSVFIFNMINELLDEKDFMESFDYINKIYDNGVFNLHLFSEKNDIIDIINEYLKQNTDLLEKTNTDNNTINNDTDENEEKLPEHKVNDLAKNTVDDLFSVAIEQNKKKESENLEKLTKNTVDDIMGFAFNVVKQKEDEKKNDLKKKVDELAKNTVDDIMSMAFGGSSEKEKETEDVDKVAMSAVDDIFDFAFNDTKSKTSNDSSMKNSNDNSDENIKGAVDSLLDLAFSAPKSSEKKEEEKKEEIPLSKNTLDDFLDCVMTDIKKEHAEKKIENEQNQKDNKDKEKKKKKKQKKFHLKTKTIDTRIIMIEEAEKESSSGEDNIIEEKIDNGYGYDAILLKKNNIENIKEEPSLKTKSIESENENENETNNLNKNELSEEILYDDNKVLKAKEFTQKENINNENNNDNNKNNEKKITDNKENININNPNNNKKENINNENLNNNNLNNNKEVENIKSTFENISKSLEPKDSYRKTMRKLSYNPLDNPIDINAISKKSLSPKSLRDPVKEMPKAIVYNSVKRARNPFFNDIFSIEKEPRDCKIPRDNNKRNNNKIENIEKNINKEPNDVIKNNKLNILNNSKPIINNVNIKKNNVSKNSRSDNHLTTISTRNDEEEINKLKFRRIFGVNENYIEEKNKENKNTFTKENNTNEKSKKNKIDFSNTHKKPVKTALRRANTQRSPVRKAFKYDYYYGYTYSSDFNFDDIENLKDYDMCSIM